MCIFAINFTTLVAIIQYEKILDIERVDAFWNAIHFWTTTYIVRMH